MIFTQDILTKIEPLDPDLLPWVEEGGQFGPALKHPLVYQVIAFTPQMYALTNAQYHAKKQAVAEAEAEGKWSRAMWFYERPYRLWYLNRIKDNLDDETYWPLVGTALVDTENMWQNKRLVRSLVFGTKRQHRELIMEPEERARLSELSEELTVYRGCERRNINGFSWTLNQEKAEWFAKRFARPSSRPLLISGTIRKENIAALFLGRSEDEIFAQSKSVTEQTKTELTKT